MMHPIGFSGGSPKFGSVFPIEVRLKNPDGQLPNSLRRNPELPALYETPWEYTLVRTQMVIINLIGFLTGKRYPDIGKKIPESVQKHFQTNLAALDPEYQSGAPVELALNWNQLEPFDNGEDVEDKNRGALALVTGVQDCDTFVRLSHKSMMAEYNSQEWVDAMRALKQWVKERIEASGQKSIVLNGVLPPGSSKPHEVQLLEIQKE